jgi:hypothetical protein
MKNVKFIETLFSFAYPKKQLKYLLIDTKRELRTSQEQGIYHAKNFATKKEATDFVKYYVPKVEQDDWKLYIKDGE